MEKSLFREIAAHTYLRSPRFDTNGKIQGATLRMMVPPEKAKAVADWLRKDNPIAARAIEELGARGKTAVVTGDVEYGKPITGEAKAGFKVHELDRAQRETRSEFDMTPENPGYLYDPRTKELVAAFTGGKWTETGDSIVIRDAKTEDGIFFRELKIDKKTGRVATADFVAQNGKEASKMLGRLRMRNPDYISGRQLDELKRTKGPVHLRYDGKMSIESGVETRKSDSIRVDKSTVMDLQEGFAGANSAAGYLYADRSDPVVYAVARMSREEKAGENFLLQEAEFLTQKLSQQGVLSSSLGLKIAGSGAETRRNVAFNLNYAVLKRLDEMAGAQASSASGNEKERFEIYAAARHRLHADYARLVDYMTLNPASNWGEIKKWAFEERLDPRVVDTLEAVRNRFAADRLAESAKEKSKDLADLGFFDED